MMNMKLQDRKYSVNRDYITLQCAISVVGIFLDTNTLVRKLGLLFI